METDGKFTLLLTCWFRRKPKKSVMQDIGAESESSVGPYIEHGSLVTIKCKRDTHESIEHYRVLAIFSKSYNKWWVHWDSDIVLFEKNIRSRR